MDDLFGFMPSRPSRKKVAVEGQTKRGGYIERRGLVVRVTPKSLLFFDDETGREIFIPLSKVYDWRFTTYGGKHGLMISDLELDDEIVIMFPRWLAVKEGIA